MDGGRIITIAIDPSKEGALERPIVVTRRR